MSTAGDLLKLLESGIHEITDFNCDVEGDDEELILELKSNTTCERVNIEERTLNSESLKLWIDAFHSVPKLKHLKLQNANLTAQTAKLLADALVPLSLESLELPENPKIGPRGCKALSQQFLSKAQFLKVLDLSKTGMGHFGAQAVGAALPVHLTHLFLSDNGLEHDGLWKLVERMSELKAIQVMDLSRNKCLDDGASELAQNLSYMPDLAKLYLGGNGIGTIGSQSLAKHIQGARNLRELHLPENNIGDEGAAHFANAIPNITSLELLDLSKNVIQDEGCGALARCLVGADSKLQSLILSSNKIGDEGAGAFVEQLDDIKYLKTLDLTGNSISEARTSILDMLLKHREAAVFADIFEDGGDEVFFSDAEESYGESQREMKDEMALVESRELLARSFFESNSKEVIELSTQYLESISSGFPSESVIRYGAFGELFSAKDEQLDPNTSFYIRRLPMGPPGAMANARKAVGDEIKKLSHPNILPIISFTPNHPYSYIVHCSSHRETLHQLLASEANRRMMPWGLRFKVASCVANALHFLHVGGPHHKPFFHGDVSSFNIYVDGSSVQLSDAGLSRLVATDRARFATGDVVFGTRGYRCPRYERGTCQYSFASDMFSFGIVMAEILTGRLQRGKLVKGTSDAWDVLYDVIMARKRLPVDQLGGPVPKAAIEAGGKLTFACLSPSPTNRPNAATVAHILQNFA